MNLKPKHWIAVAVALLVIAGLLSLVVGPNFLRHRSHRGVTTTVPTGDRRTA